MFEKNKDRHYLLKKIQFFDNCSLNFFLKFSIFQDLNLSQLNLNRGTQILFLSEESLKLKLYLILMTFNFFIFFASTPEFYFFYYRFPCFHQD